MAVESDKKIAVDDDGSDTQAGIIHYYEADIVSRQMYYPFGMIMPNVGNAVPA